MTIELDVAHDGFMLTQYESKGKLDREDFDEYIRDEYVQFDISDLSAYNEYQYKEKEPNPWHSDLNELLENYEPYEICRMCQYGSFNYGMDYHRLDGYGNLESAYKYEVEKEMNEDENFKSWFIENYVGFDNEDLIEEVIAEGNRLVAMGY